MKGLLLYGAIFLAMFIYYYTMRLSYRIHHGETEKMDNKLLSDILLGSVLVGIFIYLLLVSIN